MRVTVFAHLRNLTPLLTVWIAMDVLIRRLAALSEGKANRCCDASRGAKLGIGFAVIASNLILATVAVSDEVGTRGPKENDAATAANSDEAAQIAEILDHFSKALSRIECFDIYMKQTIRFPMKMGVVELEKPSRLGITKTRKWVPLKPGEQPKTMTAWFHQVRSRDGKCRNASERGPDPPQTETIVDDGTTVRVLIERHGDFEGIIRQSKDYSVQDQDSYLSWLNGGLLSAVSRVESLGERSGARTLSAPEKHNGWTGVLIPENEGWDFHVWFDPDHGFLPRRVEGWQQGPDDSAPHLLWRNETVRYHQPEPGVWVPVEMTCTMFNRESGEFFGRAINQYQIVVDVEHSRWNAPLDENLFLLPYPAGIRVIDSIDQIMLITGDGDDGLDRKQLALRAAIRNPVTSGRSPPRGSRPDEIRQQDRSIAKRLLEFGAILNTNNTGAVTGVSFLRSSPGGEPGLDRPVLGDAVAALIAKLPEVATLSLDNAEITDAGLQHLAALKHLKSLSLDCTRITDEGVKHLAPLKSLERLSIQNNFIEGGKPVKYVKFTDAGMAHLVPLQNLTNLRLMGTDVTDAGLEYLKALPRIQHVSVENSGISPDGLERLKVFIPSLR